MYIVVIVNTYLMRILAYSKHERSDVLDGMTM